MAVRFFVKMKMILFVVFGLSLANYTSATDLTLKDANFASCVKALMLKNNWQDASQVTAINCNNKKISSIDGIDQFENLNDLSLYKNNIDVVDLTQLKVLESLNLARNQLSHLQIQGLSKLKSVYVFGNKLTSLRLIDLPALNMLKANSNELVELAFSNLLSLEKVYIFDNKLTTVDIYGPLNLNYMDCRQNPMPDVLYEEMDKMTHVTFLHDGNADDW